MSLKDDLYAGCRTIFATAWESTTKYVVPEAADLRLGNHAGYFDGMAVLYADLNGSTAMVDGQSWEFSAEVYKSYLHCAAKIVKARGGVITAYDGDRIMAVFIGSTMESDAVSAALEINYAVKMLINPALKVTYANTDFVVKHTIGIDKSPIHVARIGVKNDNDLVWVGRAANHAAKLTTIPIPEKPIWISHEVHESLRTNLKQFDSGLPVWEKRTWNAMSNQIIYGTDAYIVLA